MKLLELTHFHACVVNYCEAIVSLFVAYVYVNTYIMKMNYFVGFSICLVECALLLAFIIIVML